MNLQKYDTKFFILNINFYILILFYIYIPFITLVIFSTVRKSYFYERTKISKENNDKEKYTQSFQKEKYIKSNDIYSKLYASCN